MSTTIRFHQYGGPEVLVVEKELVGAPQAGQVRLRQEAVGVNFIDTIFRQGLFPMSLPGVTGVEAAGVVEEVGPDVESVQVGDRVAYFLSPGSYVAERLINAADLIAVPEDLTTREVATILTKGLTAWAALNGFYKLQSGDKVLIQGASSNVGLLVARWARARGALVIGTTGSPEKLELITGSVDHALLSNDSRFSTQLEELLPTGADVVYEFVGRATFATSVASVKDGGTIVTIGAASGPPEVDQAELTKRNVRLAGGPMAQHLQGRLGVAVADVFQTFREGTFGEYTPSTYPLEQAALAHSDIASRRKIGPMVLLP